MATLPELCTASMATLKPAACTAATSTEGKAKTWSICQFIPSSQVVSVPRSPTSAKSKSVLSAKRKISAPSSPETNSPFSFKSFSAFHCSGLCEAVRIMPPAAAYRGTSISTVGVVLKPALITSMPKPCKVLMTNCSSIGPEGRASRPITTVGFDVRDLSQLP